jgi:hypothetical protein
MQSTDLSLLNQSPSSREGTQKKFCPTFSKVGWRRYKGYATQLVHHPSPRKRAGREKSQRPGSLPIKKDTKIDSFFEIVNV